MKLTEQESLKLTEADIGKYFKTRDGKKAFCVGVNHLGHFVFYDINQGYYGVRSEDGLLWYNQENDQDIIAPWPETRTIKGWVNIFKNGRYGVIHSQQNQADIEACVCGGKAKLWACKYIEITYTEGEGVND